MFSLLVGVAVVGYEAYIMATNYGAMTQAMWGQSAVVTAIGLYCVYTSRNEVKEKLSGLFTALRSKVKSTKKPVDNVVLPEVEPENGEEMAANKLTEVEMRDYECLMYLRNRVVELGDAEGIEACKKLNQVMFNLGFAPKVEKVETKNEVV